MTVSIRKFWIIVLVWKQIEYWSNYSIRFENSNIRTALTITHWSYWPEWLYQWRKQPVCHRRRNTRYHCWESAVQPMMTLMWCWVRFPRCHDRLYTHINIRKSHLTHHHPSQHQHLCCPPPPRKLAACLITIGPYCCVPEKTEEQTLRKSSGIPSEAPSASKGLNPIKLD